MKKILTVLFITISTLSFGQKIDQADLIGKWVTSDVTVDVSIVPHDSRDKIDEFKKAFVKSEFQFNKNGKFFLKLVPGKSEMVKELNFLNDREWIIDTQKNIVKVGTKNDDFTLMFIQIVKDNGKTYFFIPGMKLEMEKN